MHKNLSERESMKNELSPYQLCELKQIMDNKKEKEITG